MKIITGVIRSGTKYVSHCLQAIGVDMPHERYGSYGIVSPLHDFKLEKDNVILHQIRNPLKSLTTMTTLLPQTWDRFHPIIGQVDTQYNSLRQMMHLWISWRERIEGVEVYHYRVEDIEQEWANILELLEVDFKPFPNHVSTATNTRMNKNKKYLTKDDLYATDKPMAEKIISKALQYGYTKEELQ